MLFGTTQGGKRRVKSTKFGVKHYNNIITIVLITKPAFDKDN